MTIGERIRLYRTESNLTQKKLSELTGIHEVTIRQYEANKYSPKMKNLEKIAVALNIPVNTLLGMDENNEMFKVLSYFPSAVITEENGKQHFDFFNVKELRNYMLLNSKGKKKALSYIDDLVKLPEYTEDEPPANE